MSEFINNIKTTLIYGEDKMALTKPYTTTIKDVSKDVPLYILKTWEIGVTWKYRVSCKDEDLHDAKLSCIRELRRGIYDDIKKHLFDLEKAVWEWDHEKQKKKIKDILSEISGEIT